MPLVEIICGEKTSPATLAKVFDYTLQIKKTPIVVNDSRGFFTSRVIGTFLNEAVAALGEGVEPASIEQAGAQAGYPAPPLQLMDELTLTLPRKIRKETREAIEAAGGTWNAHASEAVIDRMVEEYDRKGRSTGAGFYDYDAEGKRTGLWPGLRDAFKSGSDGRAVRGPQGADALRRGARDGEVLRRGRADVGGRRQHRLDLRHRLPGVDRRCHPVHQPVRGWPAGLRRPVA